MSTAHHSQPPPPHPLAKFHGSPPPPPPARQGYRPGKSDGVLIAWTALCAIFPLAGLLGEEASLTAGFVLGFLVWVVPAFLLTIIYLLARAGRRRCPACGTHVATGRTGCAGCGHDFAAVASR